MAGHQPWPLPTERVELPLGMAPLPLSTVHIARLQVVPGNELSISLPSRPDLVHWSDGVQVLSWQCEQGAVHT